MKFELSPSALALLLRGFFFVIAIGSLYGVWDNRELFLRPPFYIVSFLNFIFGILFLYFTVFFNSNFSKKYLTYGTIAMWFYTVLSGIIGSVTHTLAIGLEEAAHIAGYGVIPFVLSELLYVIVLPSIVFLLILRFLRKCSK